MPKSWDYDKRWSVGTKENIRATNDAITTTGVSPGDDSIPKGQGDGGVLLVAAVGQEPRLGRWIRLKGSGIVNSALVVALRTRKATG